MGLSLFLGFSLLVFVNRPGFNLARSLVLGEVELFLDLTLATGQLLIALLALEVRADFGFQLFRALVGIGDVCFQSSGAFLKALDVRFE